MIGKVRAKVPFWLVFGSRSLSNEPIMSATFLKSDCSYRLLFSTAYRVLLAVVSIMMTVETRADWPGWRGQFRDGRAGDVQVPEKWPNELTLLWSHEVGIGHASPVISGNRIYQFVRNGERELLKCFDFQGHQQWVSPSYLATYRLHELALAHGKGPKSTPMVVDDCIFTLGINSVLSGWSPDDGSLKWRREFKGPFGSTSPRYGTATSPLAIGRTCITHVGGQGGGKLLALDGRDGSTIWEWHRDGPGYSSPVLARLGKTFQIVVMTQENVVGVASRSGALLWKIPYKTDFTVNTVTPTVYKEMVIVSGFHRGITAYRLDADQLDEHGRWTPVEVWHNPNVSMYMSSPVIVDDRMYGFSQTSSGELFCLNPANGELIWTGEARMGDHASLVATDNYILVLTDLSELMIIPVGTENYERLATYFVSDRKTWAHPVWMKNSVLIKDTTHLMMYAFGNPTVEGPE